VVGEEVEAYLATFNTMWWNPELFPAIRDHLGEYDQMHRVVGLIHLADYLEHNLDYGTLYYGNIQSSFFRHHLEVGAEMALILGFPSLATEMRRVHQENCAIEIPVGFRQPDNVLSGKNLVPKSCRRRYTLQLKELAGHWLSRFNHRAASLHGEIRSTLKAVRNTLIANQVRN